MDAVNVKPWAWSGSSLYLLPIKRDLPGKPSLLTAPLRCRISNLTSQAVLFPDSEIYADGFLPVKCFERWADRVYSKLESNSHDLFDSFNQTLSWEHFTNLETEKTKKMSSKCRSTGTYLQARKEVRRSLSDTQVAKYRDEDCGYMSSGATVARVHQCLC